MPPPPRRDPTGCGPCRPGDWRHGRPPGPGRDGRSPRGRRRWPAIRVNSCQSPGSCGEGFRDWSSGDRAAISCRQWAAESLSAARTVSSSSFQLVTNFSTPSVSRTATTSL
ncbi:hypothetical protein ACFFX0_03985 [Citricoccus parietis]|uniref:Uncharacterized protein n=1 Tax=Citricoccus parietis TaxID=592307 RepID=A0ABV5FUP0_9MICC